MAMPIRWIGLRSPVPMGRATVSIVAGPDLTDRVRDAIHLAGGLGKLVGRGDRVLIKPNLVDGSPAETGETTHPETVALVVKMAKLAGAKEVMVGESRPGCLELIGEDVERAGGRLVNFDDEPYDDVRLDNSVHFAKVRVARSVLQCDILINIPTLKTNQATGLSVGFKNMFGAIPSEDKLHYHRLDKVEEAIVDIVMARKPDLTVVDGTYSTLHWGPRTSFPETRRMNLALAGLDPVAIDAVSAKAIGVEPRLLRFLAWANARGLGVSELGRIRVVGAPIGKVCQKTTSATEYVNRMSKHVKVIDGGSCSGCFGRIPGMILWNIRDDEMADDVYVLIGPEAQAPSKEGRVIVCGDCTIRGCGRDVTSALLIGGCPPPLIPLKKELLSLGGRRPGPRDFPDGGFDPSRVKATRANRKRAGMPESEVHEARN
jgi:uncharacterized protein (DUF362 family)